MTDQKLDILRRNRQSSSTDTGGKRATGWKERVASFLPIALILGFVALLFVVLGERLLPARELDFSSVVAVRAEADDMVATPTGGDPFDAPMLFQASGWVEPDPLPIKATALVDGVVNEVEVLEGETVEAGQILATLIDEDAELDLRTAEERRNSLSAQAAAHRIQIDVTNAQIGTLKKQVEAAKARRAELADQARRFENLPAGSVPERDVTQAKLQLSTQDAEIEALEASGVELEAKILEINELCTNFNARIAEAETEVARMKLALDRTRIASPVDGVVLRLLAVPGQKRMLGMDDPDSATIAILYEPDRLQARIDVPLEEAAKLAVGQPVRIRSNFLPNRIFHGRVTRIVGEADLQRNTLQAKVRIDDPDPRLRPEMLCRAEFLALSDVEPHEGRTAEPGRVTLFVPESALSEVSGNAAKVWVLDASGERITLKDIVLGTERREDHRIVSSGLKPGDRVVLNPPGDLEPGERVKPAN